MNEQELLDYGMKKIDGNKVYPMQKHLAKTKAGKISICVTTLRNAAELCLMLPNGDSIFIQPESIEELETFEKCIGSWEPNY